VCLFRQGTQPEEALLDSVQAATVPFVPANGTVAGSAVQMALSLGAQPVILLGMDMAALGIAEHVRPNAFDEYYTVRDCRLHPEESGRAMRIWDMYPDRLSGGWRTSPSLRTYSGWFSSMARAWQGRVPRVSDSPADTGCPASFAGAEKLLGCCAECVFETLTMPPLSIRKEKAAAFIDSLETISLNTDLAAMIDTAGVLQFKKNSDGAEEKLRRTIADFSRFLYALVKAY
jgi:hypothetical protein